MNDPRDSDRPTILIVDDTPDNIMLLSALLKDQYRTRVATNGALRPAGEASTPATPPLSSDVNKALTLMTLRQAQTLDVHLVFYISHVKLSFSEFLFLGFSFNLIPVFPIALNCTCDWLPTFNSM